MLKKILIKIKQNLIGFILGAILFGSIGIYAAIKYNASEIGYKDKTVEQALNDLYEGKSSGINAYGVKRNINSSSSSWTRIGLSEGKEANAQTSKTTVKNDFDNIYPWSDIKSYNYNTDNNQITAWYGEEGFEFDGSNGEVMTYIPEFYYMRVQVNGYEYVLISKTAQEGFTKSEAFSIGRYTMSADKNGDTITKVHSRSGYEPVIGQTITDCRNYAKNIGMQQLDYHYFIIQLLYLVEYADYNSQAKLGLGVSDSTNEAPIASGGCNDLGMKSGTLNNDGKHSVIYRGIEDIYGNIWQWIDGINMQNGQVYINYSPSTYAVDTFSGNYNKLGYSNSSVIGYSTKLGYDANNPLVSFPIGTGGSENNYISDYYYQGDGNNIALVGSGWSYGSKSGFWYWYFGNSSAYANSVSGARLLKTN